jgi:hypothetical protein
MSEIIERSSGPKRFSREDIRKLAPVYINNNLNIENPAIADVEGDGDFDILRFNKGTIEFYENAGSLDNPFFIIKDKNFDSYSMAVMLDSGMPLPVFFADSDGDGDLDLFAVKGSGYNTDKKMNEYRILYSENYLDIDTATLITIILVLVIVLLVLAIIK